MNAGTARVAEVVGIIHVLHINVVGIGPIRWPGFVVSEPIAAVLKAIVPGDHSGTDHSERVGISKMGLVTSVRNPAIMVAVVPVAVEPVVTAI